MQQIYRRKLMPKCDFNKVAKQLLLLHFLGLGNRVQLFDLTLYFMRLSFKNAGTMSLLFVIFLNFTSFIHLLLFGFS